MIVTSGFPPDYARWVRFPAFDAMGFPLTDNGASTVVPGLFFCGVHFLQAQVFGAVRRGRGCRHRGQSIAHRSPQRGPTKRLNWQGASRCKRC